MISIHNLLHTKEKERTLQRWQKEAKEANNKEEPIKDETFRKNLEEEKRAIKSALKSIPPKENETIIKIDEFFFTTRQNILSFTQELDLNINLVRSLEKNIYLALGGVEEKISFEGKIFIEHMSHFVKLKQRIKDRELLSFSTLQSKSKQKILITHFSSITSDWLLDSKRNISYHTKSFSITGVLFD